MKLTPEQKRDVAVFHKAARYFAMQNDFSCHVVSRLARGEKNGLLYYPLRTRYEKAFNAFDQNIFRNKRERLLACLFAAEMVKTGDL